MNKERLLLAASLALAGYATIGQTKSVHEVEVNKDCKAIVVEHGLMKGGLTLPISPDGKRTIIFLNNQKILPHELSHSEQACEQNGVDFVVRYITNPAEVEADADRRMERRMYERKKDIR